MLVPTMSLPQMISDARKDFPALWNKLDGIIRRLRKEHLRDRSQTFFHLETWESPRKNNWLIHFTVRKAGLGMHPLIWSYDDKGRVFALIVTPTGTTYCLHNHLIQRYGERFDPTAHPLERLCSFFMENHFYATETVGEPGAKRSEVRVGMNHGLGLGEWDHVTDVIHVRTFVSFGQLFPEQMQHMERLDAMRHWNSLTPGQQTDRLNKAERQHREDEIPGRAA